MFSKPLVFFFRALTLSWARGRDGRVSSWAHHVISGTTKPWCSTSTAPPPGTFTRRLLRGHRDVPLPPFAHISLPQSNPLTWPSGVCAIQSWLSPTTSVFLLMFANGCCRKELVERKDKGTLFTGELGLALYKTGLYSGLVLGIGGQGSVLSWRPLISSTCMATPALTSGFTVKVIFLAPLYLKYFILIYQKVTAPLATDHKYTQIQKPCSEHAMDQAPPDPYIFATLPWRYKTSWVMGCSNNPSRPWCFILGVAWEELIIYTQSITASCSWDIFQARDPHKVSWL